MKRDETSRNNDHEVTVKNKKKPEAVVHFGEKTN